MTSAFQLWHDSRVAIAQLDTDGYEDADDAAGPIAEALEQIASSLDWSSEHCGPFGAVIPRGARVLVKPNWVLHANQGPWGIEPLLTHASVIRAVVTALLRTEAATVVVGDAPIQSCDFGALIAATGLANWAERLTSADPRFLGIRDFRRTTCVVRDGIREASEERISRDEFVLFDLGTESLLEAITDDRGSFRVTQYDPAEMAKTHCPGRHQYLVARDVMDADVVLNLPKLKTHKKAGVTCALKNLIGINGNKEYLPHHRVGGAGHGGDCYPGANPVKRALEFAFDQLNGASSLARRRAWLAGAAVLQRATHLTGDRLGVEGSWAGNDTIWRTCLDLNRILLYGRSDGSLADGIQRRVLHVVDAIVAGQGDGPLSPQPLPLGMLLAGSNAAAVDWIAAQLLGYAPARIPIAREAFGEFRWPLASFHQDEVRLVHTRHQTARHHRASPPRATIYPIGWLDAVADPSAASTGDRA